MDRTTPIALEVAMLSHQEMIRGAERRLAIREVSNRMPRSRIFGIRQAVGHSLIAVGERIHIDECERIGEDFGAESLSLNLAR
jgi:hypothetical protein